MFEAGALHCSMRAKPHHYAFSDKKSSNDARLRVNFRAENITPVCWVVQKKSAEWRNCGIHAKRAGIKEWRPFCATALSGGSDRLSP
ncbi:MAG: hypothetical protein RSD57_07535 [Comamonas sp.]